MSVVSWVVVVVAALCVIDALAVALLCALTRPSRRLRAGQASTGARGHRPAAPRPLRF